MNIYIARQPIYDQDRRLYGYEFLYRDSHVNSFNPDIDGSTATRTLVSNLVNEFGLDTMTGGLYAFVNFTRDLLMTQFPFLLDNSRFIIEILESVKLDESLLFHLEKLQDKGYRMALDDYTGGAQDIHLESIEILKVDFILTPPQKRREIALRHKGRRTLLAEKVETEEEFNDAIAMGYTLFQGYYFSKPVPFSKPATQVASNTCLLLWEEMRRPYPRFDKLADIISKDVDLMYKFLSKASTLQYTYGSRITDIRNALVHIGLMEIRRWVIMILINDITGKGNSGRTKLALVRGSFGEKLAEGTTAKNLATDAYLAGMFSVIETEFQSELMLVLEKLNISSHVSDALLGRPGILTELLHFIYAYERGEWDDVSAYIAKMGLDKEWVVKQYMHSISYAEQVFSGYDHTRFK